MADFEERGTLLGDENEGPLAGRQEAGGPERPMSAICDPSHLLHRVVVLVFMCFLGFGEQPAGHSLWSCLRWHKAKARLEAFPEGSGWDCCGGKIIRSHYMILSGVYFRELLLLWQPSSTSNSSHTGNSATIEPRCRNSSFLLFFFIHNWDVDSNEFHDAFWGTLSSASLTCLLI